VPSNTRRDVLIIGLVALIIGIGMAAVIRHPGYTDAYYYFNAGQRLAQGKGLTDAALWTYIGAPAGLPVPSHLYWMPLASLVASFGMLIAGPTFDAAQIPFVLIYVGLALTGYSVGLILGQSRRVAWLAALLTLFSGFFMPYWTTTDTFAVYGLVGALALLTMGLGRRAGNWRWFAISGALCGLAHLARADGVLLVGVLIMVAVWPRPKFTIQDHNVGAGFKPAPTKPTISLKRGLLAALVGVIAYLIVMSPWFMRNLNTVGSILPSGGLQTAWMRSYDEIVNYPPSIDLARFIAWGPGNILASRWEAFKYNVGTFVAVEGMVVLAPLLLIGLWKRRHDPLLSGVWLYALGLHVVMTLVFAFPGYRGGLFHSASALIPFWAALGILGLDDVLAWAARRRRWPLAQARLFFSSVLILWAAIFSAINFIGKAPGFNAPESFFRQVGQNFPNDAVVMINDPAALYYFTGISGVVVPNATPDAILDLAKRYGVKYVVLDANRTVPMNELYEGRKVPFFLRQLYADGTVRIFRVIQPNEGGIDVSQ